MKTFPAFSKPVNLRDSLHQHLHTYALAASAAGVSMLALAQPGEAEIIYTPVQVTIGPNQNYNLDLNNDGIVDFTIKDRARYFPPVTYLQSLFVQHPPGNAVAGHIAPQSQPFPWAYALATGVRIGKPERHFIAGRATMAWYCQCDAGGYHGGSWLGATGLGTYGYLGLKFKIDGKVHYGWAALNNLFFNVTLYGYAYETIPNKAIKAGQTQEAAEGVEQPAPATLGALAKGASALRVWRRNEGAAHLRKKMSLGDSN